MKPGEYQVGGKDSIGNTVKSIVVRSDKAVVYRTEKTETAPIGEIRWDLDDGGVFPTELQPAVSHFDSLAARIKGAEGSQEEKQTAYELLGNALFQVLNSGDPKLEEAAFQGIEAYLAELAPHSIRGRIKKTFMTMIRKLNWPARLLIALVVLISSCISYARIDAWRASKISPSIPMYAEHPGAAELIVVAHGYKGGPEKMTNVLRAIKEQRPEADIMFVTYPTRTFGNANPFRLAAWLEESIEKRYSERKYSRINLCGHSIGALLVRKAYVYGCGNVEDAPVADGGAKSKRPIHEWVTKVERIVLLAGMNRGWSIEYSPTEMGLWDRGITKFGLWIARVSGTAKCIRSFQRGEPFVANLRLQWLAVMERAKSEEAGLRSPTVVQLLGDQDDLVSKADSRDVAVARDFIWVGVNDTGHSSILQTSDEGTGLERKQKIQKAFGTTNDIAELKRSSPILASDVDTNVTTVVFVLHGIRDMGEWTSEFKTPLEERFAKQHPGTSEKIYVYRAAYGYFPMGAFLTWGDRQKNVRWFMDQVTELTARFPRLKHIHFIGHSNGTYVLASALEKYQTLIVERVVFAGSVVPRRFGWSTFQGRVKKVRNYVGSADWVVGLFPKLFELPLLGFMNQDLGSAGYNGFEDGSVQDYETRFIKGGHGAALVAENVNSIVDFILDETKTDVPLLLANEHPGWLDLCSRLCWGVWLALLYLLILFGRMILAFFYWRSFVHSSSKPDGSSIPVDKVIIWCLVPFSTNPFKGPSPTAGRIACAAYCGLILYLLNTI